MNIQSAKGVTLIHVMVLMALLGAILVSEIQKRQSFSDTQAFYYTIAQTQMALNNAFGEVNSSGNWPGSAGGCVTNPDTLNNGWGMRLYCVHEGTTAYRIIQYLPSHLGGLFLEEFKKDGAAAASAVAGYALPAGFAAYSVRVDRSGGAEQRVDFTALTGSGSPATVDKIVCESGASEEFVALGGMESYEHSTQQLKHPLFGLCGPSITVSPHPVRSGFILRSSSSSTPSINMTYDMYRPRYNTETPIVFPLPFFVVPVDGIQTVFNDSIVDETVSTTWGCLGNDYNNSGDLSDGNFNARHEARGQPIEASLFQYCK